MPSALRAVLLALAFFCFVIAAFIGLFAPTASKLNFMSLGLAFLTASFWSGTG